jgi:hypothetical protein
MGWVRIASEILHQGKFVTLRRDTVIRPDGREDTYEHLTVDDGVRVVALDDEGQVLLVEDDFYLQGRRLVHLPGGGCGGQRPPVAALRELGGQVRHDAVPRRGAAPARLRARAGGGRPGAVDQEDHDGEQEPTRFECFWIPLSAAHVLQSGQDALLGRLFG